MTDHQLVALLQLLCVIIGSVFLSFAFGWQIGAGIGFFVWALMPQVK